MDGVGGAKAGTQAFGDPSTVLVPLRPSVPPPGVGSPCCFSMPTASFFTGISVNCLCLKLQGRDVFVEPSV